MGHSSEALRRVEVERCWDWPSLRHELTRLVTITAERTTGITAMTSDGSMLLIDYTSGTDTDWLIIRAAICHQHEMDLEQALERNGRLALSTLMLAQGAYWLRMAVPFDSAELHDPCRLLAVCSSAARSLSPVHVKPMPAVCELFAHYTD